jgi:hypothetical protein
MVSGNIRQVVIVVATAIVALGVVTVEAKSKPAVPDCLFNDSHFHLTRCIQQGERANGRNETSGLGTPAGELR